MSEDTDSSRWLRDLLAARLDGRAPELYHGCVEASYSGRIGHDKSDHFLHFTTPSPLPASAESASLADAPIGLVEPSSNEKGFPDEERMVEGDHQELYPSIPILVTLTIALMIAIFMIGLDTNIIGESVRPKLVEKLGLL